MIDQAKKRGDRSTTISGPVTVNSPELAEAQKANKSIATQDELPAPITTNKTWWECKFCNFHSFCHGSEEITNKNCRTCAYSTSMDDSTWFCEKYKDEIPEDTQKSGCEKYEVHDHLIKEM